MFWLALRDTWCGLQAMEPIEFVAPEIEDPVEWVKGQRRKRTDKLKLYRDGDL